MTQTVFVDEIIETELANLHIVVDYARVIDDIEKYKGLLMISRGIPFDLDAMNPGDALIIHASKQMDWATPEKVIATVKAHYRNLEGKARNDAAILAITRTTPKFEFNPEPYPEEQEEDEWNASLPEPFRDLSNPVERRLKQVIDTISSDITAAQKFWTVMETIAVLAERKSRKIDDDGFQPGRSTGIVSSKAKSSSKKSQETG